MTGNTWKYLPLLAPIYLIFAHMFFFTNTKPGSQGIAIAIKIPSIPEVLRTLLATILPWLLLNSQCLLGQVLVVSKELRVKQFHFVANRHSHHMWPAWQDANLAKHAKICQMLKITGKFSTSDPAYIQHQLFHKEPVSVISCLIARDLRAVEHFDTWTLDSSDKQKFVVCWCTCHLTKGWAKASHFSTWFIILALSRSEALHLISNCTTTVNNSHTNTHLHN